VSATSAIAVAPDGGSRYPLTRETEPPGRRWLAPWFPPVGSVALALASAGHAAARAGCRHRPGPHGLPACGAARAIGGTNNKDSGSSGSPDSTMDGVSGSKRQAESAVVRRLYSPLFQTDTEWKGRSCSTFPVLSTLTKIIQATHSFSASLSPGRSVLDSTGLPVNQKGIGSSPVCRAKHFDFERRVLLVNDRDANSSEMANTAGKCTLSESVCSARGGLPRLVRAHSRSLRMGCSFG
jgi:hypothetical protein